MADSRYVKHVGFDDPILINAEDFDPEVHSEVEADAPTKKRGKGKD